MTPQETESDWSVSVQEFLAEAWVDRGMPRGWGIGYTSPSTVHWKDIAFIAITPTLLWPQGKLQGGNTAQPIKKKLD